METQENTGPRKWTFLFYKGYFPFQNRLLELAVPVHVSVLYKLDKGIFVICGEWVRRRGEVGKRVKENQHELLKPTFFILKNHFKVLAPIWDGEIPSGFQRLKSREGKESVKRLAGISWMLKTKTQEHRHCPFKPLVLGGDAVFINFNHIISYFKYMYLQKKFKISKNNLIHLYSTALLGSWSGFFFNVHFINEKTLT